MHGAKVKIYLYFLYPYVVLNPQIFVFLILRSLSLNVYHPNHHCTAEMPVMHQA
jgi:hypothetical protein